MYQTYIARLASWSALGLFAIVLSTAQAVDKPQTFDEPQTTPKLIKPDDQIRVLIYDENNKLVSDRSLQELAGVREVEVPGGISIPVPSPDPTWFHYRTPQLGPSVSKTYNGVLTIAAQHNSTHVYFGGRYIGVINAGAWGYIRPPGSFVGGTGLETNFPVQASVWNDDRHWVRGFSLWPKRKCGTIYRTPALRYQGDTGKTYVSVAAFENNTTVTIEGRGTRTLHQGQIWVVQTPFAKQISAEKPVYATAWQDDQYWVRGITLVPLVP